MEEEKRVQEEDQFYFDLLAAYCKSKSLKDFESLMFELIIDVIFQHVGFDWNDYTDDLTDECYDVAERLAKKYKHEFRKDLAVNLEIINDKCSYVTIDKVDIES